MTKKHRISPVICLALSMASVAMILLGGNVAVAQRPAATTPVLMTNMLGDSSFEPTSGSGNDAGAPIGWHRSAAFTVNTQGPLWDQSIAHSGGASLSILDSLPDAPGCPPLVNAPNSCEMWYSDPLPIDPNSAYRLHFWALAPSPARAVVGLFLNAGSRVSAASTEYAGQDSSAGWGEGELNLTPEMLATYGSVSSAIIFVRGASTDDGVHQIWVDDIEFGSPAALDLP